MTVMLYLDDAFQQTHYANVLDIKQARDGVRVLLNETIFYPTGGGQPHDTGTLGTFDVLDVSKADGRVWHHLAPSTTLVVGQDVALSIDWSRRWDHMQQHSAQHLITALAEAHFGWATLSFHLGELSCSIELDTASIEASELVELHQLLSDAIGEAIPVQPRVVSTEEMQALIESQQVRSRGLPAGHVGEIRLVEIEGVDINTCGGTHVAHTAQLKSIILTGTTRRKKHTLLHFLAGERALAQTRQWSQREADFNVLLSCGAEDHLSRVEGLQQELKQANATIRKLQEQAAQGVAHAMMRQPDAVVAKHVEGGMPMLQAVARHLESTDERLFVLSSGAPEGVFMIFGGRSSQPEIKALVQQHIEGRGGGRPPMFQGQAKRLDQLQVLVESFKRLLSA